VKARWEAVGRAQRRVLEHLGPLAAARGFYLAGGTGLALQLGHRRSVDFDWFTGTALAEPLLLSRQLREDGVTVLVDQTERGTLHGRVSGVRVSFIEYQYPLVAPLVRLPGLPTPLASVDDIACMKLSAVTQRGARKDFIDLHAVGRVRSLPEMLRSYERKYGVRDVGHVLHALTYFEDADRERGPVMLRRTAWTTVKTDIRGWVRTFVGRG
jgi:hypothetical protein